MPTRPAVTTFPFETSSDVAVTTWGGLLADDDGEPVRLALYSDRSIQVAGTFDAASITIAGSNDGVEWHALTSTDGNSLALTSTALKQVVELPVYIKPRVFGGGAGTNLTVILAGRRSI